jgi:hypothetical protein
MFKSYFEAFFAMDHELTSDELMDCPAELTGRTPRRVRITGTGWLNLFAAVLFSSIGIGIMVAFVKVDVNEKKARNELRQNGRKADGQVTDMWIEGKGSVPHISYTFSVDGTFYSGKSEVPREIFRGLHKYDPLLVSYLAGNPDVNHPAPWEDSEPIVGPIFIAGFFVLFGLMFMRRFPVQRRLAMEGIAIRGSITECWGPGRSGGFGLKYTFRNARSGETESGSCSYDSSRKVGSDVWLLYLSSDPRRSEVYPFGIPFYRIER